MKTYEQFEEKRKRIARQKRLKRETVWCAKITEVFKMFNNRDRSKYANTGPDGVYDPDLTLNCQLGEVFRMTQDFLGGEKAHELFTKWIEDCDTGLQEPQDKE